MRACLVSLRRVSGQRYSAFKSGDLRVHRPARRTQVRLRGLVLRKSPRLKGMRSAAAPKLAAHGTFWPWGVCAAAHRVPSGKDASTPASRIGESGADASSRNTAPCSACASARLTRTVAVSSPCARSSVASQDPDPRSGGVFVRLCLRRCWRIALRFAYPPSEAGSMRGAERRGGVSEINPDKHGS